MLFNSTEFLIFLPLVFALYWFVTNKSLKLQNLLVLLASYVFYGWWDWRFLSLIVASSFVDFTVGNLLYQALDKARRKLYLGISIVFNIGLLGFFKYYNFFIDSFITAFQGIGITLQESTLYIILPVGISFYTFQTLSYTIDIYRNELEPTKDMLAFFAFVSFFPQLVAGPIERARNLLPQFLQNRQFDYELAKDGMRQILWGLFKKIVIADTIGVFVNDIFYNYETYPGSVLLLGAVYFAFQIYCDFSGYSDIAIGTAKLFGFRLMTNFKLPYFSRNVGEFWQRWHISLSTWFRDYVYIPLGGSRCSKAKQIRNSIITFTVSGFWHGANWTFVFWGFLNGLYYVPAILFGKKRYARVVAYNRWLPGLREIAMMALTFFLILITWVFFRSATITEAFSYLDQMFSASLFSVPSHNRRGITFIVVLVIIEWFTRHKNHALQFERTPVLLRWPAYLLVTLLILGFYTSEKQFIYFQF